jgi:glucose-6-phosphate 1-dehydrogenase
MLKAKEQLPTIIVIFGGGGDLTWRKLTPALFCLFQDQQLPQNFSIIGVDVVPHTASSYRRRLQGGVKAFSLRGKKKLDRWKEFSEHVQYLRGDFKKEQTYQTLVHQLNTIEKGWKTKANYIFYLATPPSMFGIIPPHLRDNGLTRDKERSRIVVEKPLGHDLQSAVTLNRLLASCFDECQIFRIDHYLGKETVQNILALRFANPLFEPLWNRHYIDYVTITVAEDVGVEHRGGYYDKAGAFRDMVQNHLMQLLCLIAMEPMVSFEADEIRNKKIDVIHALRPIPADMIPQYVVRGQYRRGWIDGKEVCGYREEEGIPPNSETETFVALKLYVDNWRWQGVPFYLRTGKRLPRQASVVSIQFRPVPHQAFPPEATLDWQPARLIIRIQPDEGIILRFQAKHPGAQMHLRTVDMRFNYGEAFAAPSPDAYETLLLDVMKNDLTLFMRADQVEAAWRLLMPVLDIWAISPPIDFPNYDAGTWGPEAANKLLALEGHSWPIPIELS